MRRHRKSRKRIEADALAAEYPPRFRFQLAPSPSALDDDAEAEAELVRRTLADVVAIVRLLDAGEDVAVVAAKFDADPVTVQGLADARRADRADLN